MINPDDTLGHVVAVRPSATHVLLRHQLDFCCGGGQTLTDACRTAGLDPATVIAEIELEEPAADDQAWHTRPLTELVDFILDRYHESLRRDLPGLLQAADRVEHVHADKPSCPHGLAEHLRRMDSEIRQHLMKEEQVLFPAIQAGTRGQYIQMPIRVMMQEHDDHGANLKVLRQLATQFEPPPEACATWRALYSSLQKLELELMEHIHLENSVLFPRTLAES